MKFILSLLYPGANDVLFWLVWMRHFMNCAQDILTKMTYNHSLFFLLVRYEFAKHVWPIYEMIMMLRKDLLKGIA